MTSSSFTLILISAPSQQQTRSFHYRTGLFRSQVFGLFALVLESESETTSLSFPHLLNLSFPLLGAPLFTPPPPVVFPSGTSLTFNGGLFSAP